MRFNNVIIPLVLSLVFVPLFGLHAETDTIEFDPAKNTSGGTSLTSLTKITFLSGGAKRDPATVAFALINTALGFLGFISMLVIIYGGVLWFRSGENEEHLTKAKSLITGALVGLVLTLGSLSISVLLFNYIQSTTIITRSIESNPTDTLDVPEVELQFPK